MDYRTHGPIRAGKPMKLEVLPADYIAHIWMNPDGTVESTNWRRLSQTDDQHHPEREKP